MLLQDNGEIYEALRTIAACYVRADMSSICDCINAYRLTETLSKAMKLQRMQQAVASGCHKEAQEASYCESPLNVWHTLHYLSQLSGMCSFCKVDDNLAVQQQACCCLAIV